MRTTPNKHSLTAAPPLVAAALILALSCASVALAPHVYALVWLFR